MLQILRLLMRAFGPPDHSEWRSCMAAAPVRLIDGSITNGIVMRRRVNGAWQYRAATDAEVSVYVQETA